MIVKPETRMGWHRQKFKLSWRCKSGRERARIPREPPQLMSRMVLVVRAHPSLGAQESFSEDRCFQTLFVKVYLQLGSRS
jgi:hypothetical protein